jgi:hypothetical protein
VARVVIKIRGGCALDHFLVAALDRTIALKKMNEIAVCVSEDLNFDVPRPEHKFFA